MSEETSGGAGPSHIHCSPKLDLIAPALLAAQKKLENPEMNAINPHFRNRYADLGVSMASAKQALNSEGIAIIQMAAPAPLGVHGLTTMLLHKSGQFIGGTVFIPLERNNAQGLGSATTYARRYGVQAIIGMVAEKDDDGEAASAEVEEEEEGRPAARKGFLGGKR